MNAPVSQHLPGPAAIVRMNQSQRSDTSHTVLLTSTTYWSFPARIARRFADLGWRVEAVCPTGHPLRTTAAVSQTHRYSTFRPLAALKQAIDKVHPNLIIPCDERCVIHLHRLAHRPQSNKEAIADIIECSLGRVESGRVAQTRSDLIAIARDAGVRAPQTRPSDSAGELRTALLEIGLPAILKVNGTWGGIGVALVHTQEDAERARVSLTRRLGAAQMLKRHVVDRDRYSLLPWLAGETPRANVQALVRGRPANTSAACWRGEVLAAIHVEVLHSSTPFGPSTVVRVIDNSEMMKATTTLIRRLGLSGLCGLDFILDGETDAAHLIEMNARATPLCHLALGAGRDPVAALVARFDGTVLAPPVSVTGNPVIANFPHAWLSQPDSDILRAAYHDVPWDDPALVRELLRPPYPERGLLARLVARLQHRNDMLPGGL